MKRRSFLLGLLAAPFAPKAVEPVAEWFAKWPERHDATYLDFMKARGTDKSMLPVIEALQQRNGFLQEMTWQECPAGKWISKAPAGSATGHRVTLGTPYPEVTWVRR